MASQMRPLVSILIPAFNAAKTISATLESAIQQSWTRKEIIVVDDGSTDNTAELAERFAPAVKVVSTENRGAAAARNHAYSLCGGDFVQWLDADDLLAPNKIERQLGALGTSGSRRILLSSPWGQFYHRTSKTQFVPDALWHDLTPVEWLVRKLGQNLLMSNATWLTSRELSEAAGLFDPQLFFDDDGEYFCRVLLASEGTRFVTGTAAYYRFGGTSSVSHIGNSKIKRDSLLRSMKLHMQYLRSLEDSPRARQACLTYMQNWLIVLYGDKPEAVMELRHIAEELGGELEEPSLRWKYAWMRPLFGWKSARWAQDTLPTFKAAFANRRDEFLYWLEKEGFSTGKFFEQFPVVGPAVSSAEYGEPASQQEISFAVHTNARPFVSILIPAYNAEATIAQTLRSAINQTWERKEIIVVDDGSKDKTAQVADQFAPGVRVVRTVNQGAAAARNHAYSLAQGDYIQWLDADDLLAPAKIESQLTSVVWPDDRRVLLAGPWAPFFFRTGHARFVADALWQDLTAVEWLLCKMGRNLYTQTATWLTSRELAEDAGPWDIRVLSDDDGEYFCRVLLAAGRTHFVPEAKVYYRTSASSRLSYVGSSDRKKEALLVSMKLHVHYLCSLEQSDRVRQVCLTYLRNWFLVFYPERPDLVAELRNVAAVLGGSLDEPSLRWKYSWIKPVFGWGPAKWAQLHLPEFKSSCLSRFDKTLWQLVDNGQKSNPHDTYAAGVRNDA